MSTPASHKTHQLVCHSQTPSRSAHTIEVQVEGVSNDMLTLTYILNGDLAALRIPGAQQCMRSDELWRHTCFELFLITDYGPNYLEYNFSPSSEWAVYALQDYRQIDVQQTASIAYESSPKIHVHRCAEYLELKAEVLFKQSASIHSIWLGLSAVVEANDGSLSYWALRHPPGKPDFHHTDTFALHLDLPK